MRTPSRQPGGQSVVTRRHSYLLDRYAFPVMVGQALQQHLDRHVPGFGCFRAPRLAEIVEDGLVLPTAQHVRHVLQEVIGRGYRAVVELRGVLQLQRALTAPPQVRLRGARHPAHRAHTEPASQPVCFRLRLATMVCCDGPSAPVDRGH